MHSIYDRGIPLGRFVPWDVLSWDVLYVHLIVLVRMSGRVFVV